MATNDLRTSDADIGLFILAKNERANIGRCLELLKGSGWDVTVLDSGSTDGTCSIVEQFAFARVEHYDYVDHCKAYNDITTELGVRFRHVIVLDADMLVSKALQSEIDALLKSDGVQPKVIEANVDMYVDGHSLRFGSLYPPKAFVFEVGRPYFVSIGHAETLVSGVAAVRTRERLRHDDRKSYAAYLQSQIRYSAKLMSRRAVGQMSSNDRLRTATPLMIFAVPFVSYLLKGGFLSGKSGLIYALDRLIAEAIMYRRSLSDIEND